jgi:hypothetical protein
VIDRSDRLHLARLVLDDEKFGIPGREQGIGCRITHRFTRHVRGSNLTTSAVTDES